MAPLIGAEYEGEVFAMLSIFPGSICLAGSLTITFPFSGTKRTIRLTSF
jgi:hypothetical protein